MLKHFWKRLNMCWALFYWLFQHFSAFCQELSCSNIHEYIFYFTKIFAIVLICLYFNRRFKKFSCQKMKNEHILMQKNLIKMIALAGNRTPVSRVAGENSTTEPPMLALRATCQRPVDKLRFEKVPSAKFLCQVDAEGQ